MSEPTHSVYSIEVVDKDFRVILTKKYFNTKEEVDKYLDKITEVYKPHFIEFNPEKNTIRLKGV